MKKVILTMMMAGVVLTSCEKKSDEVVTNKTDDVVVVDENETEVVDNMGVKNYVGTYNGTVPCASCEGIDTSITLNEDGTYTKDEEYLGQKEEAKFSEKGTFVWNDDHTQVILTPEDDATVKRMYLVEEGQIKALDADGKEVEGELADAYILTKK
ncbi:MAG: copper resistance protein NlpE [Weeksellaceae bacterium]